MKFTGMIDKPIIFLDFEYVTSKFKNNGSREYIQEIIEIGLVVVTNKSIERYSSIIKPRFFFSGQNTGFKFSKITKNELENGADLSTVVDALNVYYKANESTIITWGGSDIYNFNHLCAKYKIPFGIKKIDCIDLSQKFRRFYNKTQAIKLEKAAVQLSIPEPRDAHRALPDAELLYNVFLNMLDDGFTDDRVSCIAKEEVV